MVKVVITTLFSIMVVSTHFVTTKDLKKLIFLIWQQLYLIKESHPIKMQLLLIIFLMVQAETLI